MSGYLLTALKGLACIWTLCSPACSIELQSLKCLLSTLLCHPLLPCRDILYIMTCFTQMLIDLPHHPPLMWYLPPCLQRHTPSSPSPSYLRLCLVTWATGCSWPVLPFTLCWEKADWWPRRMIMRYESYHAHQPYAIITGDDSAVHGLVLLWIFFFYLFE